MANPEHLAKLQDGLRSWNTWRFSNKDTYLDLRKADLSRTNLSGAILMGVNLREADLSRAYLSGATLWECAGLSAVPGR